MTILKKIYTIIQISVGFVCSYFLIIIVRDISTGVGVEIVTTDFVSLLGTLMLLIMLTGTEYMSVPFITPEKPFFFWEKVTWIFEWIFSIISYVLIWILRWTTIFTLTIGGPLLISLGRYNLNDSPEMKKLFLIILVTQMLIIIIANKYKLRERII